MHSEDVEVASACAPLRGYTMHVWHPSQQVEATAAIAQLPQKQRRKAQR
jgi:hypothetical protein